MGANVALCFWTEEQKNKRIKGSATMRYTKTSSFLDAGPVSSNRVGCSPSPRSLRDSSPPKEWRSFDAVWVALLPLSHCVTAPLQRSGAVFLRGKVKAELE